MANIGKNIGSRSTIPDGADAATRKSGQKPSWSKATGGSSNPQGPNSGKGK